MGGKTKQSQRTKNNVRPSSSGRSAELLHNAVNLDTSLMTGGSKMMSSLFPTLATPNLEQGLTPEFSLCIKKLNKKDPITKVKALQELSELVNSSKVDDVVSILPSWAHYYKILTVDTDCKVREATQACQGAVAAACGRRLAGTLRALVPAWLQARHDDHPPAAALADGSLQATFPESKLPEVISFCKAEIMAHLMDNLLENAEKTLIKRIAEPEERELQLQRIVTGSLRCLEHLTTDLPPAHDEWFHDQLTTLFEANAFWKYPSHSNPALKAAWFACMAQVLQRRTRSLRPAGQRLARCVLRALHAPPPALAPHAWGCLLHLVHALPEWHQWLEKKDMLTKRLLEMLEKGGWGDAKRLSDLLLPLIAHLPQDVLTKEFYEAFFIAFFNGLRNKSIMNSKSERQYWITSLAECLRYLSIQQNHFAVEVTTSVHRMWLRTILFTEYSQVRINSIEHSATGMVALVKYWLKLSKEGSGEKYDQLVRNFWQNVCTSTLLQIDKPAADEIGHIIEGHIALLRTLKTGLSSEAKKVQSVKFQDDEAPGEPEPRTVATQAADPETAERYRRNLNEVVEKTCCAHFEHADKNDVSKTVLTSLTTILTEFDSGDLHAALARHFAANGILDFYERVLVRWALSDATRCEAVVDIAFLMLEHLAEEEQEAVMASFDKMGPVAVECCLARAARPQRAPAPARRWLRAPPARRALLRLARRPLAPALLHCVRPLAAEMLISDSTASEIAEVVGCGLDEALAAGAEDLEPRVALAAQLATLLAPRRPAPGYLLLLRALLDLLLLPPGRLPGALWAAARDGVRAGLAALAPPARARLRAALAARVHARLPPAHRNDKLDTADIENITSLCPYLLTECNDAEPPADVSEIVEFTRQLFDMEEDKTSTPVEVFALRHDCITGNLNCPFDDDNEFIKAVVEDADNSDPVELTIEILVPYINKLLFRAMYLHKCFLHRVNTDGDDEGERQNETWCRALLSNDHLQMEFCKVLRDAAVLNSLDDAYSFWLHHDLIMEAKTKLNMVVDEIIAETPEDIRSNIASALTKLAAEEGYYWAYARTLYEARTGRREGDGGETAPNVNFDELDDIITGNGFFHSLQAACAATSAPGPLQLRARLALAGRALLAAFPAAQAAAPALLAAGRRARLDPVLDLYHAHHPLLLYERDIAGMPWREVVAEAAVLDAVTAFLQLDGWDAPQHYWDFATVTLCAVFSNVRNASEHYGSTKVSAVARAAAGLYVFVRRWLRELPASCERRAPAPHVAALPAEWADVFGPALDRDIFGAALALLEPEERRLGANTARLACAVAGVVRAADWAAGAGAPPPLARLLRAAAACLAAPRPAALHCLAYRLLAALGPACARHDAERLTAWSREAAGAEADAAGPEAAEARRPQLSVHWLHGPLARALARAAAALDRLTPGLEAEEVRAGSAAAGSARARATGALLLAAALHQLTAEAAGDLAHHYTRAHREAGHTLELLALALRLLPPAVLAAASSPSPSPPASPARRTDDPFLAVPDYEPADRRWQRAAGALACRALYVSVAGPGAAAVRSWWAGAGRARGPPLARLVRDRCSPALVAALLARLRRTAPRRAEVRAPEGGRVARATCGAHELTVRFGPDYPLSLPAVSASAPASNWILVYIAYQNGSLADAVRLWAAALGRGGGEDGAACYVCYCHLQPLSGAAPDRLCHQCGNCYHRDCLRKWFVTSQRTSCPLCRTSF